MAVIRVKKIRQADQQKVDSGIGVKFGEADFTLLPGQLSLEYSASKIKVLFLHSDEEKELEKEKTKVLSRKPVNDLQASDIAERQARLSRSKDSQCAASLIKGWRINEADCEVSAQLIYVLSKVYPECLSGEVGKRTAKYSDSAAKALCADRQHPIDIEFDGADDTCFFQDVIYNLAAKEATNVACSEIPVEKFVPLAGK